MSSTVAFFGATGDCAGWCLAETLKSGDFTCRALARTPDKLTKSMEAKGVSKETLERHLTIVQGDIRNASAVKKTLQLPSGGVVEKIVSGIGGTPTLQWSILRPVVLTDSTICRDAGATILSALQDLKPAKKPLLINVSTTGIAPKGKPRDVPLAFLTLYHWLLADPHEDKAILEERLREHVQLSEAQRGIRGYVNVKPSLLMDGEGAGLGAIREGTEDQPAVGYTIARKDVGLWMADRLVKGDEPSWLNGSISITQ